MDESGKVCICVDVAGSDRPASLVLEGVDAALAADEGLAVAVVGPAEDVEPFAAAHPGRCVAVACSQVIGMDEHPAQAVRSKRDASIVVGCRLVREGRAQGIFSAGSTGAVLTAATLLIGRIKGIDRPALTAVMPGPRPTVLLDLGANADCKPEYLVQFAHMGSAYARTVLGVAEPTVALLNIGAEQTKGSKAVQEEFAALTAGVPAFVGNAEPRDLFSGRFDVLVADGFTGNIALKTLEATAKFVMGEVMAGISSSADKELAAGALKPSLARVKDALSGDAYGGAVLLGTNGIVVKGHGATSVEAVKNGIAVAAGAVRGGLVQRVQALCAR